MTRALGIDLSGINQEAAFGDVEQADVDLDTNGDLDAAGGSDAPCETWRD